MRHLLSTAGLGRDAVTALLGTPDRLKKTPPGREVRKLPTLGGHTVVTSFPENSTRTRASFEIAGKWMNADVVNVSAGGSSVQKGESPRGTVLTLSAMGADAVVVRHPASGTPHRIAGWVPRHVVNAGDGMQEHPTQALLDVATLRDRLDPLDGRSVTIVGDMLHRRVAQSNVHLLTTLGARVHLVAPSTLPRFGLPHRAGSGAGERWDVTVGHDLDAALPQTDAGMALRVQPKRSKAAKADIFHRLTLTRSCIMSELFAIKILDDEAGDETRSLIGWLQSDDELKGAQIRSSGSSIRAGEMGIVADLVEVAMQPDGIGVALITGIVTWLSTRKKSLKISITRNSQTVRIEVPRASDIEAVVRAISSELNLGDGH